MKNLSHNILLASLIVACQCQMAYSKTPVRHLDLALAQRMSQATIISFYKQFSISIDAVDNDGEWNLDAIDRQMHELMGDKKAKFKLTLTPKGKIAAIEVLRSSGSDDLDEKLTSLITKSAPFAPNKFTDNIAWIIRFPKIDLTPAWAQLPDADDYFK